MALLTRICIAVVWVVAVLLTAGCVGGSSRSASGQDAVYLDGDIGSTPSQISSPIVINEVNCRGNEWVELTLVSGAELDVSGWVLTDDPDDPDHEFQFSEGTTIGHGEFFVIDQEDGDDESTAGGFDFGIACGRDTLTLLSAEGVKADSVSPPDGSEGQTWGRLPDGTGDFAATAATRGAANSAYVDQTVALYDPFSVASVALTISESSRAALEVDPREYVTGSFTFTTATGQVEGPFEVGIRLKGQAGSSRPLTDKPGFKVRMDFEVDGQRFRGLRRLTFNNLVQDPSMIREALVYHVFREFGVPAPRIGYVEVTLNGEPYGLYANIESPDRLFLNRWFDSTEHLYEGAYGVDLASDRVEGLEVDVGDEDETDGLDALVEALEAAPRSDILTSTSELVDWDEALRMMAIEVWSGHWDGYAPSQNNYYLHEDEDGRFSLIPWGTDQAFTSEWEWHRGAGLLFERCMADVACRDDYDAILLELLELLDTLDLDDYATSLAAAIDVAAADDDRKPYPTEGLSSALEEVIDTVERRTDVLEELTPCLNGSAIDGDNDGFVCDMDCNENDASVHVGAVELCDGIDQDCSGAADDTDDCPDCTEVVGDESSYLICTRRRHIFEAAEYCGERGYHLVTLQDAAEETWLRAQIVDVEPGNYWIGYVRWDESEDAEFEWLDESDASYTNGASDQPVDFPEARCTLMTESDGWEAVDCGEPNKAVCERD